MKQKSYNEKAKIYLVPTPIGNFEDMTIRAINILKEVDIIFCEDTRETKKLLNHFDIKNSLHAYHKFNEDITYQKIIKYLENNKNVAIVSDRGTPSISDPGYVSVYKISKLGYNIICLPGATAFVPALVMSGINPNKFLFYGFLNSKKSKKKIELENLKNFKYTIIFYESPFRIIETLELIKETMGNINISVSREISKKFEEVYRGLVSDVLKELEEPKGEFVIVIEENQKEEDYANKDIIEHVNEFISSGLSEKDAIKKVSKLHGLQKNIVYMKYKGEKI